MIALWAGETEEPLFENRVLLVPEREREAETLVVVADPEQAVLSPAIRTSAGMVVGEIVPRGPVLGVVLPDGSPLALAQVGTPPPPVDKRDRLGESLLLLGHLGKPGWSESSACAEWR